MSIRDLLAPETKGQAWSKLYCYQINVGSAVLDGTVDFDGDVHIAGQCTIGPNDFQVSNGVGLNGQVLTTNGGGTLSWESDGGGNVLGPVSSVAGHFSLFADTTGKLIADSGLSPATVVQNPAIVDWDAGGVTIENPLRVLMYDQGALPPPPANACAIYSGLDARNIRRRCGD